MNGIESLLVRWDSVGGGSCWILFVMDHILIAIFALHPFPATCDDPTLWDIERRACGSGAGSLLWEGGDDLCWLGCWNEYGLGGIDDDWCRRKCGSVNNGGGGGDGVCLSSRVGEEDA
jgi:hypothetical protein